MNRGPAVALEEASVIHSCYWPGPMLSISLPCLSSQAQAHEVLPFLHSEGLSSERGRAFLAVYATSLQSCDQSPSQLTPELCHQGWEGLGKRPGQVSRALGRAEYLGAGRTRLGD